MRLIPRTLKWRTILLTLLGLAAVGASVWWTFRAEISAFVKRQQTLDKLRHSPHALDRTVGSGELRAGMPVVEFVTTHPPKSRLRHDEYETLMFEGSHRLSTGSLRVIAVDGVIVFAGTDTTEPLVGKLSPDEAAAYGASIRRCARRLVLGPDYLFG